MKTAKVKIETTTQKQTFFNEWTNFEDKVFLGLQNVDDDVNLGSFLPKKIEFLPVCVDVSNEKDVKIQAVDLIKKEYNNNTPYKIKVTLEIELED